ncbi:MAG: apolipoprotein N-acyltransferase [Bacteroidetes bacterium]|nr:apolipoprotein N-acyltransferase [Bacteroidota bacterium]
MKKYHLILLSVLSGLLLAMAWPTRGFPGLLFVAFIPLFFIEDYIDARRNDFNRFSVLFYVYPAFLIWCGLTTYWIWKSTPAGAVGAVMVNALLMAFVFNIFHITKRNIFSPWRAHYILVFYWISFEFFHLHWELNWPWLNLGNGFANYIKWIQWYEFTGAFGGTLWVLVVNILIYHLFIKINGIKPQGASLLKLWSESNKPWALFSRASLGKLKLIFSSAEAEREGGMKQKAKPIKKILSPAVSALLFILIPLIISLYIYHNYREKLNPVSIIITQPNIDPYTEQYTLPPDQIIEKNLDLAISELDEETDFIVCPESAIQEQVWENRLEYSGSLKQLKKFIYEHPRTGIVIGASTFREFLPGEEISRTARKFSDVDLYYDAYNTVFYLDTTDIIQLSHKSRLTPGVEILPYSRYLKFIEKFAIDLGGTIGTLGTDPERKVFIRQPDSLKFAAVICYESVFGEFFSQFVRNGAELMFIITNDGWWGDTPGHRQHLLFAPLRAIETRRSIARSANTGISAFINHRGDICQSIGYWKPGVIKQDINANSRLTFYTKYGNYIARISCFISGIFLLCSLASALMKRKIRI